MHPIERIFNQFVSLILLLAVCLFQINIPPVYANELIPAEIISQNPPLPLFLKGLRLNPDKPSKLEFIVDLKDQNLRSKNEDLNREAIRLINYFLTTLTVPQDDIWVNLSPYEHERIIADKFGLTEMGKDFLNEDFALKKLAASLIDPTTELGKNYWKTIYQLAFQLYGTTNIRLNSFNKVWIVPDKSVVYVHNKSVYVVKNHLKVLSDKDYVAADHNQLNKQGGLNEDISSQVVKELLIPVLEKEINESDEFLKLRQIYDAVILGVWYKQHLKSNFISKAYVNQNKVHGVESNDKDAKRTVYNQYLSLFKKGVFNFVKEEYDSNSNQSVVRKYFAGGLRSVEKVEEKYDMSQLSGEERNRLPSDQSMLIDTDLLGLHAKAKNPYGINENICRTCGMELDPAYGITNILNERGDKEQKLLLIGVGSGVSASELVLRYPKLQIWAINKESFLWNDEINLSVMEEKGFTPEQYKKARERIHVLAFDMVDAQIRDKILGNEKFDLVFFEPRTQVYFTDKIAPIQDSFNKYLKQGGILGFVANGIFTSQEAFENSDFGSPLYERNPDLEAVSYIKSALAKEGKYIGESRLGGNLYLKFERVTNGEVQIPLKKIENKTFTTPLGLKLVWSIYQTDKAMKVADQPKKDNRLVLEYLDSLMDSAPESSKNPILLLAGDPGAGKTTIAEDYKNHLKEKGENAVVINTDRLFKTKALLAKQIILVNWLKIPFTPQTLKDSLFNKLLINQERVNSMAHAILDLKPQRRNQIIHIEGFDPIVIRPDTTIIIEGSLANLFFGQSLPITRKVYMAVASDIQEKRINKRGVDQRGYSQIRAKITTALLSSKVFAEVFGRGIEDFDATILTDDKETPVVYPKGSSEGIKMQDPVVYPIPDGVFIGRTGKYGMMIDDKPYHLPLAAQLIAEVFKEKSFMSKIKSHKIVIGFSDANSLMKAQEIARILTANKIQVSLSNLPVWPYMVAERTHQDLSRSEKYDLGIYVQSKFTNEEGHDVFELKLYEDGVTTYLSNFDHQLSDLISELYGTHSRSYRSYPSLNSIPPNLLNRMDLKEQTTQRLKVFDVDALKKKIPSFVEQMKTRTININPQDLEEVLSSYGTKDASIGKFDLHMNSDGAHGVVMDIGNKYFSMQELALIFAHYLYSKGERGPIVRTAWGGSELDRLGSMLKKEVVKTNPGVRELLNYPQAMIATNSTGHIHFSYRGEHFMSSKPAETLLALEIMLNTGKTLSEYLEMIHQSIGKTVSYNDSIDMSTVLKNGDRVISGDFIEFQNYIKRLGRDPYSFARGILSSISEQGDVSSAPDSQSVLNLSIELRGNWQSVITIKGRYSTSEKDTLRLYIETPAYINPQVVFSAVKRLMAEDIKYTRLAKYAEQASRKNQKAINVLLEYIQSGKIRFESVDDRRDEAMNGGISFKSQLMNIQSEGEDLSNFSSFINNIDISSIDGIAPIISNIRPFVPDFIPQDGAVKH